jgi:hypothetical protein
VRKSFFISLLLLVSCVESKKEIPVGVISKDTMARVLINVHLAEAKVSIKNLPPDSSLIYYQILRENIYKKFGINQEKFDKSMSYYTNNVKELDQIYEVVVDSLGLQESKGKLE